MRAGAGRADLDIRRHLPLDGFGAVSDPLEVRVLVAADGPTVAWVVIDLTSVDDALLAAIRAVVAEVAGVAAEDVVVSASHTFSAPHLHTTRDGTPTSTAAAIRSVLAATAAATAHAVGELRDARIVVGHGRCGIAVNRDEETADGWGLGRDEAGFSDTTLIAARIEDTRGAVIATLVNLAVQPSVFDGVAVGGQRTVSADLAGAAMREIETTHPGSAALFLIGCAGDQAPALTAADAAAVGDDAAAAAVLASALGHRLASAVERTLRAAVPSAAGQPSAPAEASAGASGITLTAERIAVPGQIATPRESIRPRRHRRPATTAARELPFWVLRLGPLVVVAVQVELSAETGRRIRMQSPFAHTAVTTMTNGAAKYLPAADAFDRLTYEAQSSRYARGGAERLAEAIGQHLRRLHTAPDRVGATS